MTWFIYVTHERAMNAVQAVMIKVWQFVRPAKADDSQVTGMISL